MIMLVTKLIIATLILASQFVIPPTPPISSPATSLSSQISLDSLTYPGVNVVDSSSYSRTLVSSDSPEKVTAWYTDQLNKLSLDNNTNIHSATDGEVVNAFIASNAINEIRIVVEALPDHTTQIILLRNSSNSQNL